MALDWKYYFSDLGGTESLEKIILNGTNTYFFFLSQVDMREPSSVG
jgi:hypothetical protein